YQFTRLDMPQPVLEPPPAAAQPTETMPAWQQLPVPVMPNLTIPSAAHLEGFSWFAPMTAARRTFTQDKYVAPAPTVAPASAPVAAREGRTGLRRRVAGAQLPAAAAPEAAAPAPRPER